MNLHENAQSNIVRCTVLICATFFDKSTTSVDRTFLSNKNNIILKNHIYLLQVKI